MDTPEYDNWLKDPTPDNLGAVIAAMEPVINSQVYQYTGPKPLLRSKAKLLTINAIKTFDPTRGAKLQSWVTTQLQPLSRYNQQLRPVKASEDAIRQAAELNRQTMDLENELGRKANVDEVADRVGISAARIRKLRAKVITTMPETALESTTDEGEETVSTPAVSEPDRLSTAEEVVYESLNPRDKAIYDWKIGKHGKPLLLNQIIAKRLGITPALVSQRSQQIAEQISDLVSRGMV